MQNNPVTVVLLKHKEQQSLEQFATMLEKIAQKLREEGQFTFIQGDKQIQVTPSNELKVSYEYSKKSNKHSFEIEFDWLKDDNNTPNFSKMGIE